MNDRQVDIIVKQQASDEELAVIVAVVEFLRAQEQIELYEVPPRSRWAEAARRDAVRPFEPRHKYLTR